jgi:hypothetical protein
MVLLSGDTLKFKKFIFNPVFIAKNREPRKMESYWQFAKKVCVLPFYPHTRITECQLLPQE